MAARLTAYVVVGIVAATLIAGLIVGAQRDDYDGPVDLIVQNGRVFTGDADGTMAEAIAVRGNQVLRVGSNRDINRLRRPQTTVVDADGAAVLPGFNDSHVHFIDGGLTLEHVDLRGASDAEEIADRIRTWTESNADAAWVVGGGWTYAAFEDGGPDRQMLDDLIPERPAILLSADGSAAWVNSRVLRLAKMARGVTPSRAGSESSGLLRGAAIARVMALAPAPSPEDRARALKRAVDEANRNGITSIQTAVTKEDDLEIYEDARKAGELKVRVHAALPISEPPDEEELDRLDGIRTRYPDDPLFKVGALAIPLDHSSERPATAPVRPERPDDPALNGDDLNRTVRLADARGWQVTTQASGGDAVRMALDAYQHAVRSNLKPPTGRRHRIEDVEAVDATDAERFGALGVLASVQAAVDSDSAEPAQVRPNKTGEGAPVNPPGSIAKRGGRVTFGSDWPAGPMNPLLGVHAAVAGTTDRKAQRDGAHVEGLTLEEALKAYTSTPAWASFDEQRKGTLTPGMLADIVVLSNDIFEAPPSKLASTTVEMTIFDGKIVYRRGARPAPTTD